MNVSALSLLIQKKLLLGLLAGSCIAVFLALLFYSVEERAPLQHLSQADSLILGELARFHVSGDLVRTIDYPVTDHFTRKRYVVTLPPGVSHTHLHSELNQKFYRYRVETVGFVNVPEREMRVLILFDDKIIRTLELRTESGRSDLITSGLAPVLRPD